jgi:hypothetical protein
MTRKSDVIKDMEGIKVNHVFGSKVLDPVNDYHFNLILRKAYRKVISEGDQEEKNHPDIKSD